jgi:hypothetical protein
MAMIVFPGGGYNNLAIDLEGTDICDWLASEGITAVLLKYRVPVKLVYYIALKNAGVPVEMHLYSQGGHGFGLRPSKYPITGWPTSWSVAGKDPNDPRVIGYFAPASPCRAACSIVSRTNCA